VGGVQSKGSKELEVGNSAECAVCAATVTPMENYFEPLSDSVFTCHPPEALRLCIYLERHFQGLIETGNQRIGKEIHHAHAVVLNNTDPMRCISIARDTYDARSSPLSLHRAATTSQVSIAGSQQVIDLAERVLPVKL